MLNNAHATIVTAKLNETVVDSFYSASRSQPRVKSHLSPKKSSFRAFHSRSRLDGIGSEKPERNEETESVQQAAECAANRLVSSLNN